jgi:hypothetical protein
MDGFDNFIIARAAAEVAHHPILNLLLIRFGVLIE